MFLPDFSALNPWGIALVSASVPIKTYFFVCYSLYESYGCTPHWLSEQGVWEPVPWMRVLRVGALDVWYKPFIPQGRSGSWKFLLD